MPNQIGVAKLSHMWCSTWLWRGLPVDQLHWDAINLAQIMTKLYEKKLLVSQPNRYVHAYEVENNYVLDILNLIMIPIPYGLVYTMDHGELHYCSRVEFDRNRKAYTITMNQKIHKSFNMNNANTSKLRSMRIQNCLNFQMRNLETCKKK